jgi:hypothetical protein
VSFFPLLIIHKSLEPWNTSVLGTKSCYIFCSNCFPFYFVDFFVCGAANAGGGAAKPGSGPVWGTDIPIPPPIPTSWPPEPYTAEAAGGAFGVGADASAGGTAGAATTSTIVNADGTVVTISLPAAAAPAKAKLKQIYLVSLPAIEGTLWAETGEELISVSRTCCNTMR